MDIPSKPARYELKCFAMYDAKPIYTNNLEIWKYCRKQPSGPFSASNSPTYIVKRLIEGSNRNLTMNNWYTSLPLAMYFFRDYIAWNYAQK